jgi:peptide/nickel transport system permease protein
MLKTVRDLFRYNLEFALGAILILIVFGFAAASFFSPYPPMDSYVVAPDVPPSWAYPFGTNSRGQDVFWQLTLAIRNSLLFGLSVALMSRILSLLVGLVAGYAGGITDRILMTINDTFVVIPLFPILVLFFFMMRDNMSWPMLAVAMASLGWPYDARLIRSVALSLRTREFTAMSVFSGMSTRQILVEEHLPYVLPIVFSTTLNNMNWSIGLEVTLSVIGFTNIETPTIGTMIYWATYYQALLARRWWWIGAPILVSIVIVVAFYLISSTLSTFLDPRTRLKNTAAKGAGAS